MKSAMRAFIAIAMSVSAYPVSAATLFTDDFSSGVAAWSSLASNYAGPFGVEVEIGAASINGSNALGVFIDAPPGANAPLFATVSRSFSTPAATAGVLSFGAKNIICDICAVFYTVDLDGSNVRAFNSRGLVDLQNILVGALSAGSHTLTLGMNTNFAFNGHFLAVFDDILLTTTQTAATPLPAALPLFAAGLSVMGLLGCGRKRMFNLD